MEEYLGIYNNIIIYPSNVLCDPESNPKLWGNVWANRKDFNTSRLPLLI